MLAALVVMVALLMGGAVVIKGTVENALANPSQLSEFAAKVIPSSLITDAISQALPPSSFRDALLQALSDPRVQSTLQNLLAAALFGNPPRPSKRTIDELDIPTILDKRDATSCRGVSDSDLCLRVRTTCYNLSECVRMRNTTVCQAASRDTVLICNSL